MADEIRCPRCGAVVPPTDATREPSVEFQAREPGPGIEAGVTHAPSRSTGGELIESGCDGPLEPRGDEWRTDSTAGTERGDEAGSLNPEDGIEGEVELREPAPEVIRELNVDDTVDPLGVHELEAGRSGHGSVPAGEYRSESFLADSPEVEDFLSTVEGEARGGLTPGPLEVAAVALGTDERSGAREPDEERPRSAWPLALLASYASVMTLATAWLVYRGGQTPPSRRGGENPRPSTSAREDQGAREGESASVERSEAIPAELTVGLGATLRVGDLEITPRSVLVAPVELERKRVDGETERRTGGEGVLCLNMKLKNVSMDQIFAPLDEGFVREPDRRMPDSFLELVSGDRIYGYPLPVRSEWNIVGQEFRPLRPGEVLDALVYSDMKASSKVRGELVWRLRLRTSPGQNAVVGVKFHTASIVGLEGPVLGPPD